MEYNALFTSYHSDDSYGGWIGAIGDEIRICVDLYNEGDLDGMDNQVNVVLKRIATFLKIVRRDRKDSFIRVKLLNCAVLGICGGFEMYENNKKIYGLRLTLEDA